MFSANMLSFLYC